MEAHKTAGFVRAAGKRDLEFAAERLRVRMAEHEVRDGFRVGCDIESLCAANAGDGAGSDVAHGIAAGFAGGDADRGEAARMRAGASSDVNEVELNVPAGGDVGDAVSGIFLRRDRRAFLELRGRLGHRREF